jgi:toxin ParE1/3/4
MAGSKRKEVRISKKFDKDIRDVYSYGEDTFGVTSAKSFIADIYGRVWTLDTMYLLHPECRHIQNKFKRYRNIILGSYLIIYRITDEYIEVLRILHSQTSISRIRKTREIRL